MYSLISKAKILQFYLENRRCISQCLFLKIFNFICEEEKVSFDFNDKIRRKIKSTLVSLDVQWRKILRRKNAKEKFKKLCSVQVVKFEVEIIIDDDNMEVDPKSIEQFFDYLSIN